MYNRVRRKNMKIIIIIVILVNLNFGRSLDSVATHPFNIDLSKKITWLDITEILGFPDSISTYNNNVSLFYHKKLGMVCYLTIKEETALLYCIEVLKGKVGHVEIGISKRKFLKKYGMPTQKDILPTREILEYAYYNNGIKHIITLEFRMKMKRNFFNRFLLRFFSFNQKKKLTKIIIEKEDIG